MDFEKLKENRNSASPFAQRLGIVVDEISLGYARVHMDVKYEDTNPLGLAHGGCYFSLADTASGSAMASRGYYAVTLNASYSYLRSAKIGSRIIAEARETKAGRTISVYDVQVKDQDGTLLGTGTFTFYRLEQKIEV